MQSYYTAVVSGMCLSVFAGLFTVSKWALHTAVRSEAHRLMQAGRTSHFNTVDLRGKSFWNGILYVADITGSGSHRAGIKIVNGSNLPDGTNSFESARRG